MTLDFHLSSLLIHSKGVVSLYIQKEVTEQEADFIDSAFSLLLQLYPMDRSRSRSGVSLYRYSVSVSLCCFRAY